jgi:4-amino-4-deoxy-L-arabinose transferase-like glycosyltransferase
MPNPWNRAFTRWRPVLQPYTGWIVVGLAILFVLGVRIRLRDMPLERDEGEYAYAGQLILHGVAPYKEAYAMKLPGTYAAYAAMMAVFGQSPAGIHLGVALLNAVSIVLVFLLGRKLLDEIAGAAAAVAFALLSLSPWVLGLAGHATHFVALAALGGTLLLVEALTENEAASLPPSGRACIGLRFSQHASSYLFLAGLLFGLAFLMKQHGLFFGVFGAVYLVVARRFPARARASSGSARPKADRAAGGLMRPPGGAGPHESRCPWLHGLGLYFLGCLLPYGLTCLVLWVASALQPFLFWTLTYARTYASAIPLVNATDLLRGALRAVIGPNLVLWILPSVGALVMWWEDRLVPRFRFLLVLLFFCSFASVSVGFYFREHYFIPFLPVLALLTGVAVSRGVFLLKHDTTIELFLALFIFGLAVIALAASILGNGSIWLGQSPVEAVRSIYGSSLFPDAARVAEMIRTNSPPDARIAVLGSEPEIYFAARRRAATGYLYMYPLMERHAFARQMQQELIAQIERAQPEYVVYVDDDYSWLRQPESEHLVQDWWPDYWAKNLDLITTIDVQEGLERGGEQEIPSARRPKAAPATPAQPAHILLLKRRK